MEEDLHPGDPGYYANLQYVYQSLEEAEKDEDASKNTASYKNNLKKHNSISQILENMKTAYFYHAKRIGKVLPEGWDKVNLAKTVPPKGAKGMKFPIEEDDSYYNPEPIDKIDPSVLSLQQIEDYMDKFDRELGELKEIQEKGTAKDYTRAKMNRREELGNKCSEFDTERDIRLASRAAVLGGSRREGRTSGDGDSESQEESENLEDQGDLKSPWDRPKPEKGTYPVLGPNGPGNLNVEGDWEGPIELFEFEYNEEGWINCSTGYYWHSVLGGGICLYEDNWN